MGLLDRFCWTNIICPTPLLDRFVLSTILCWFLGYVLHLTITKINLTLITIIALKAPMIMNQSSFPWLSVIVFFQPYIFVFQNVNKY